MMCLERAGVGLCCAFLALNVSAAAVAEDFDIAPYVDVLRNPDKEFRAIALDQLRTGLPGEEVTIAFAELLPDLPPATQAELLAALAARKDSAAAPAVRKLLTGNQEEAVRVAAVEALGALGTGNDVPALVNAMSSALKEQQDAARRSLVLLRGEAASETIVDQIGGAPSEVQVALIEVLATRRARNAIPAILKLAVGDDPAVRRAAMASLGKLGEAEHVAPMVEGVLKAQRGRERDAAEKMVMLVCHRIPNQQKQAAPLLAAMDELSEAKRNALLSTLGRVGGPQAREVIERAIDDPELHAVGVRALCNWPFGSIAPRLLELARTDEDAGLRRTALRALIRVAPLPDERTDQRRLDELRTAMAMCQKEEDRLLALERAKAIRTVQTLRFLMPYVEEKPYAEQACLTVVELAHSDELREPHRKEFHRALDRVLAVSKDPTVLDRAQRYKEGRTWVRPKRPQ